MDKENYIKEALSHLDVRTTPEDARRRLEYQGFEEDMWDNIMKRGVSSIGIHGSHATQALIVIARGDEPQRFGDVCRKLRLWG